MPARPTITDDAAASYTGPWWSSSNGVAINGSDFHNDGNLDILQMATSINGELLAMSGPRNPYPGKLGVIEEGALADLLLDWIPDARQRDRVLADNPAALYGWT